MPIPELTSTPARYTAEIMAGDWVYWLIWLGILALYACMVWLAWRSLFSDRANGRRRCPRCWYDLAYSPGMTCAECGYTGRTEADFQRTRRRYGQAAAAILVCVLVAGVVHERVNRGGWTSTLPAGILISILPLSSDHQGDLFKELERRISNDALSEAQLARLMRRAAEGDWFASPMDERWMRRYGDLIRTVRRLAAPEPIHTANGVEWPAYTDVERPLLNIPPRLELTTRETWPTGSRAQAQLLFTDWWPRGCEARVRLTPRHNAHAESEIVIYRSNNAPSRSGASVPIGVLGAGEHEIQFDVQVDRRRPGAHADWQHVATQSLTVATRVEGSLETHLIPIADDDALNTGMREAFTGSVSRWEGGPSPVRFRYTPTYTQGSEFAGVAIGVSIELRRGDQLARQLDIWWLGGPGVPGQTEPMHGLGWEVVLEDEDLLLEPVDESWTITIRGDPQLALRAGNAASYWAGSFTVPAQFVMIPGPASPPEWRREPPASRRHHTR